MVDVLVDGSGTKSLTTSMFKFEGGEGKVFVDKRTAYKVCHPGKCIPEAKFRELEVLDDPRIIKPKRMLRDPQSREPIGYSMTAVNYKWSPCHLFPRSFLRDNNVTIDMIRGVCTQLAEITDAAHEKNVLIVDWNELNSLVDHDKCKRVAAIDVNGWQTKSFPCQAVMNGIRDWTVKGHKWTEFSDWFSWGVVTFQLWTGLHPFEGRHPDYKGTLDVRRTARMANSVSVFNSKSTYPGSVEPFKNVVPPRLLEWYKSEFEEGCREKPPTPFFTPSVPQVKTRTVVHKGSMNVVKRDEFSANIVGVHKDGAVILEGGIVSVHGQEYGPFSELQGVFRDPVRNQWFAVTAAGTGVEVIGLGIGVKFGWKREIAFSDVVGVDGEMYVIVGSGLHHISFLGLKKTANILPVPNAIEVFPGTVMQNFLGTWHALNFTGPRTCQMVPVPELDGHKLVSGMKIRNVLQLCGANSGAYQRHMLRFGSDGTYDIASVDVAGPSLNLTVNDAGVGAQIDQDDVLTLFSARKDGQQRTVIPDSGIDNSYRLWTDGLKVLASRGNVLYEVSTK